MPVRESETKTLLVRSALAEFGERGFLGTDSNRIARRAGFAPQTFYRWFRDKTEVFVAAYEDWQCDEVDRLRARLEVGGSELTKALATILVEHHRQHRIFRRSLRLLAIEDETVRAARTASRRQQIQALAEVAPHGDPGAAAILLLQVERLCDGLADDEFRDLGIDDEAVVAAIVACLDSLLQPGGGEPPPDA